MKRFLGSFLIISLALVALVGLVGLLFYMRLPIYLSGKLSKSLHVPVQIEEIQLSFDNITLLETEISNVPQSTLPKAFSAKEISFDAPVTNYVKNPIVIEEITLDEVYLGLEFESPSNLKSNWSTIMSSAPTPTEDSSKNSKQVIIKTLILTNIEVELVYKNKPNEVKKLPPIDRIVLTNVNTQEGLPMDQIMHSVLGQMLKSVFIQENLKDAVDQLFQSPQTTMDKLLSPFKGVFG